MTSEGGKDVLRPGLVAILNGRRLPLLLAAVAVALTTPALFIGLHLDDFVHRFLMLHAPGSELLARSYVSPFAIANGDPALNHWLVQEGYAPWWTYERLLLSFFRPISVLTHRVDYALWPDSPFLMHAHSLLWFGALVGAAAVTYRGILGVSTTSGLAAYLYAVDHSHGFAAGWIANRNALPPVFFGLIALYAYDQGRRHGSRRAAVLGPVAFLTGLLSGEMTLGALAYIVAHAATLDPAPVKKRLLAVTPYLGITVVWRVVYNALGYGARGSGLYLDPVHEPLRFAGSLFLRVPLLVLGETWLPPAEGYYFVSPGGRALIFGIALACTIGFVVTVIPLAKVNAFARFWAIGALLCLPLACTAYPHNRLLYFVSFGAMALIGQLLHDAFARASWLPTRVAWHAIAQPFLFAAVGVHAFLSPLLLPLAACGILTTQSITDRAVPSAVAALSSPSQDLVVVSAPEYFFVNLIPIMQSLAGRSGPAHLRMLSVGPVPLAVKRLDSRRLLIDYEGGLLATPLPQLYRGANIPMTPGQQVILRGLSIELTRVTPDGRPAAAVFTFDEPLESPRYRFIAWGKDAYVPFEPPKIGESVSVAAARMPFEVRMFDQGS